MSVQKLSEEYFVTCQGNFYDANSKLETKFKSKVKISSNSSEYIAIGPSKKIAEKNAAEKALKDILSFKYGPTHKTTNATNKLKNKGINIRANGIKILKF